MREWFLFLAWHCSRLAGLTFLKISIMNKIFQLISLEEFFSLKKPTLDKIM